MSSFGDSYSYSLNHDSRSVALREEAESENMRREHILEQRYAQDQRQRSLNAFTSESRDFLLSESLSYIMSKCFPSTIDESLLMRGRAVVESFVAEEGSMSLLNQFKTKTLFLSELANIIESTHKKVLHSCEGKDAPFKITNSDMKAFHNRIDTMNTDTITKEIVSRVTKAEEEFMKANLKDKETLEELAEKTKQNIDNVKAKDSDTENEIKQECSALYRRQVDNIMNRKKSILESMVLRMSKAVVTEESVLPQFTQENGKLDMQKIIDVSEVMYTFLEMVNTLKIKNVTSEYLHETLSSIK